MYTMIGAGGQGAGGKGGKGARGVAGRINHSREKSFMEKLGRPTRILLRPGGPDTSVVSAGGSLDPEASVNTSRTPSRSGSVDAGQGRGGWKPEEVTYGDECLGGKLSLLHFCVTFLMAGVIVLVVGAVQFKPEAEMFEYRQVIVTLGCAILGFGFALFFIKCTCFCRPKKMKIPDCSREEGEVKHQNGGTKKEKETVISPTSPILNHGDAEENCREMVIIQSDKSTAQNKTTNGKPVSKNDYANSEKIIQAEVEICYS